MCVVHKDELMSSTRTGALLVGDALGGMKTVNTIVQPNSLLACEYWRLMPPNIWREVVDEASGQTLRCRSHYLVLLFDLHDDDVRLDLHQTSIKVVV